MSELSPAAQAVLTAFLASPPCIYLVQCDRNALAAVLRAAADQVVPDAITWQSPSEQARHWPSAEYRAGEQNMAFVVRRKLLLIANELNP